VSGTWRACDSVYDEVSGTFRKIHAAPRAIFKCSSGYGQDITIYYMQITIASALTYFGDLIMANREFAQFSSSTRAIFAGGWLDQWETSYHDVRMQYITMATTGNMTFFGNLSQTRQSATGSSNQITGLIIGGLYYNYAVGQADYPLSSCESRTIATTGNASGWSDLARYAREKPVAMASPTRSIVCAGDCRDLNDFYGSPTTPLEILYCTFAGSGWVNFGDMVSAEWQGKLAGASSNVRGVYGVGYVSKHLQYVTITTTGNALSFGDLANYRWHLTASSSKVKGVFSGGYNISSDSEILTSESVYISTTANATSFGDLSIRLEAGCATSTSHGGL